jgi:hypothetical protein
MTRRKERQARRNLALAAGRAVDAEERVTRVGFASVSRVEVARREVELCATSEALDSFGTIFDYAASKDAFTRWMGNVREMHERVAVGRRVAVRFEDETRRIFVTIRISRGAEATWEKVLDGTLRGASIGATNVRWERQRRSIGEAEREVDVATRYDLVELSLVDNPSNPDALGVTFVRDATPDVALLDQLEDTDEGAQEDERADTLGSEEPEHALRTEVLAPPALEVVSGQINAPDTETVTPPSFSGKGAGGLGSGERFHVAARSILAGCGCPLCAGALAALDDGDSAERLAGAHEAIQEQAVARALGTALRASVAATTERLDRLDETLRGPPALLRAEAKRGNEQIRDLTTTAGELRRRIETMEAQPLPGGPVAGMRGHPEEKRLATANGQLGVTEQIRALESLAGRLVDPQAQLAVAAELIRLQREG